MSVKPFYCKTEGLTAQQVQDVFDKCVDKGANAFELVSGAESRHDCDCGPHELNKYKYFGVDFEFDTFTAREKTEYGKSSIELTYDQIDAHLGLIPTETSEEKEALDVINPIEWANGDYCCWTFSPGKPTFQYVGLHCENKNVAVVWAGGNDYRHVILSDLKRPETPKQREERERMESAKYLLDGNPESQICKWDDARSEFKEHILWIVDETGYRKEKDA